MGDFVDCFGADFESPDQPELKLKEQVKTSLINNLKDAISSVRQGAATSLGKYLKKYPTEFETFFKSYILTAWEDTKNQKKDVENFSRIDKTMPAQFGVVREIQNNKCENQTMYSCGSLAPKMKATGGGCSAAHGFSREAEKWEVADGCVMLFSEVCGAIDVDQNATAAPPIQSEQPTQPEPQKSSLFPTRKRNFQQNMGPMKHHPCEELISPMLDLCRFKHFKQHTQMLQTICKKIPEICENLKPKRFKKYLVGFGGFEMIFYAN